MSVIALPAGAVPTGAPPRATDGVAVIGADPSGYWAASCEVRSLTQTEGFTFRFKAVTTCTGGLFGFSYVPLMMSSGSKVSSWLVRRVCNPTCHEPEVVKAHSSNEWSCSQSGQQQVCDPGWDEVECETVRCLNEERGISQYWATGVHHIVFASLMNRPSIGSQRGHCENNGDPAGWNRRCETSTLQWTPYE